MISQGVIGGGESRERVGQIMELLGIPVQSVKSIQVNWRSGELITYDLEAYANSTEEKDNG